ncbi:hypothetical protein [Paenibacillus sp. MBLB4367]|uniref:hypothetical protein n=1 Tax=Paenibacillus sp. MBLB4367 TaxID=3384767 RepID=UPI0039080417
MAQTYSKAKIEHYLERLRVRSKAYCQQSELTEFKEVRQFLLGQISANELIIKELKAEFGLCGVNSEEEGKREHDVEIVASEEE